MVHISKIAEELNKCRFFPAAKVFLIFYAISLIAYSFTNIINPPTTNFLASLVLSFEPLITSATIIFQIIAIQKKSPKMAQLAQIGFGAYMVASLALAPVIAFCKLPFGLKTTLIGYCMYNLSTFRSIKIYGVRKIRDRFSSIFFMENKIERRLLTGGFQLFIEAFATKRIF